MMQVLDTGGRVMKGEILKWCSGCSKSSTSTFTFLKAAAWLRSPKGSLTVSGSSVVVKEPVLAHCRGCVMSVTLWWFMVQSICSTSLEAERWRPAWPRGLVSSLVLRRKTSDGAHLKKGASGYEARLGTEKGQPSQKEWLGRVRG